MVESLPFQYQKRDFWEFYCPICKSQRRSFYWPSPRRKHYVQLAVLGIFVAGTLWPWAGLRGAFLVLPVWAIFEFFYRARARQSLICPHCGFDPYLYKYDVKLARQKVQRFFEEKAKEKAARQSQDEDVANPPANEAARPKV